ncbi:3-isopropylmalate dehydratase large subunit [Candidimonas nitroreducens]|uniref:3-isopropylmalate dehydratase n=1 Tax=Candidimonas nitroreducens TaxID=683354 RepID=A0A225MVW0_9BURK|nr:3-isopropylmalate dehydratase large subunit [Candidimonas nitroreducens]OWT63960.1 3-isopropylmalate dehydratase large subunit [Candidimonas nitroreducens]
MKTASPLTLFDKVWQRHVILERDGATLLHVGRHLVHDGSRNAFQQLYDHGLNLRRPDRTFATPDHYVPTETRILSDVAAEKQEMVLALNRNARQFNFPIFPLGDERQGIVHVVGPEQGITLPGLVIVCGDSHTATHGAFGALAFGVGTSEVAHVLATQALWQIKPKSFRIDVAGTLPRFVTAKDLILHIICHIGANGAGGHVLEYAGSAIRGLSMEGRMTLCNMSIEAGARAGMIAPDDLTFAYLRGRRYAPSDDFDEAVQDWRTLHTDADAVFDREVRLDASAVVPMLTWGTSPQDAAAAAGSVPDPDSFSDPVRRAAARDSLAYMGLSPRQALETVAIDRVFIGSCTNARIEDLRAAAGVLQGRRVRVPTMVVPGSTQVKRQAEQEGVARILTEAGVQWRESACSMCSGTNGDVAQPGQRVVSTTNRNFVGRQGKNVRTHLASPETAAACAVAGRLIDPRELP